MSFLASNRAFLGDRHAIPVPDGKRLHCLEDFVIGRRRRGKGFPLPGKFCRWS